MVVDPDGKIWVCTYYNNDSLQIAEGGVWKKTKSLLVFNPDGTPATISPVRMGTFDGVADTLFNAARGLSKDNNGNILYSAYDELFRFNYQTGEGMNKVVPKAATSLTEAAATSDGYIIVGHVAGGNPIHIFDGDFGLYSFVEDTNLGLQRSIVVSPDGKDVYVPKIYSGCNGVVIYHGEDGVDGTYERVDTVGTVFKADGKTARHNMWGQCLDKDANGLLWVGTYWDVGVADFNGWYALDPTQGYAIVDTIGHSYGKFVLGTPDFGNGAFFSPRGVDWTADGKTAYIADFEVGAIMKFTNNNPAAPGGDILEITPGGTGIRHEDGARDVIVVNFRLDQNYPNPFNPTTNIPFEIRQENLVKLTIYDLLGREVKTLVNEKLTPGNYTYRFDATNMATGLYIYRLEVNGQMVSKKMTYLK